MWCSFQKCRRSRQYEQLRQHLSKVFKRLAVQKESRAEEGHLMSDHVRMMNCDPAEVCGVAG